MLKKKSPSLILLDVNFIFFVLNLILNKAKEENLKNKFQVTFNRLHINLPKIMKSHFLSFYWTRECLFCHTTRHKIAQGTNIYQCLFLQLVLDFWSLVIIEMFPHVSISPLKRQWN